jgi:hypothetical protein
VKEFEGIPRHLGDFVRATYRVNGHFERVEGQLVDVLLHPDGSHMTLSYRAHMPNEELDLGIRVVGIPLDERVQSVYSEEGVKLFDRNGCKR